MGYVYSTNWSKKEVDIMMDRWAKAYKNAKTPAEKQQAMEQMKRLYQARPSASDARQRIRLGLKPGKVIVTASGKWKWKKGGGDTIINSDSRRKNITRYRLGMPIKQGLF